MLRKHLAAKVELAAYFGDHREYVLRDGDLTIRPRRTEGRFRRRLDLRPFLAGEYRTRAKHGIHERTRKCKNCYRY